MAVRVGRMRAHVVAEAKRLIRIGGKTAGWSRRQQREQKRRAVEVVSLYSEAVLKPAEFAFYERLFARWHVFAAVLPDAGGWHHSRLGRAPLLTEMVR
jgi:hypothetical protein